MSETVKCPTCRRRPSVRFGYVPNVQPPLLGDCPDPLHDLADRLASAPPADARLREEERDAAVQRAARLELSEIAWRKVLEECKRHLSIADTYESANWNGNLIGVGVEVHNALRHLRDERDAALTECAAQRECIEGLRALRFSPAASEPSKGARETPALDEFLSSRCVHDNEDAREAARAELSALKSAAPERPAMAVEAHVNAIASMASP